MTSQEIVKQQDDFSIVEQLVLQGDLSKLTSEQRVMYYRKVCESAGLNPFTGPFAYIYLNGKLTLYAKKDCTEQLRKINCVSIEHLESTQIDDVYIVKARARDKSGRTDESTGAVVIGSLKGEQKANALMKAETKAKRRVTLSICGMGWCDESEIDSIPSAKSAQVDLTTGEIKVEVVPEKKKISAEQSSDLKMMLGDCDDKFREWIMKCMESKYGVFELHDLPAEAYDKLKNLIMKHVEEVHARQRQGAVSEVLEPIVAEEVK